MAEETTYNELIKILKEQDEYHIDLSQWEGLINSSEKSARQIYDALKINQFDKRSLRQYLKPPSEASLKLRPISALHLAVEAVPAVANDSVLIRKHGVSLSYAQQGDGPLPLDETSPLVQKLLGEQAFWDKVNQSVALDKGFVFTPQAIKSLVQFSGFTGMNKKRLNAKRNMAGHLADLLGSGALAEEVAGRWLRLLSGDATNLFAVVGDVTQQALMWQMANELMLQDEALDAINDTYEMQQEQIFQNIFGQVNGYETSLDGNNLSGNVLDVMLYQHTNVPIVIDTADHDIQKSLMEKLWTHPGNIHFEFMNESLISEDLMSLYQLICYKRDHPGELELESFRIGDQREYEQQLGLLGRGPAMRGGGAA